MAIDRGIVLGALLALTGPAAAQEPLSVIDWLSHRPEAETARPAEPPATGGAIPPEISTRPLDAATPLLGLVPSRLTGLPETLWQGSDPATLVRLLASAGDGRLPALRTLLYTLLLTESRGPEGPGGEALLLTRLDRLRALGAVDAALAMLEDAGPAATQERVARWFDLALLAGEEAGPCAAIVQAPHLSPGMAARTFCAARSGDPGAATLLFDGAVALDLIEKPMIEALDRYLHPDLFEDAGPMAPPASPSPLLFRLFEASGEPLPSSGLPVAFAAAELRGLSGWRAQIEAAERLAATGALPANRLLGIYTEREPAASGGVWDRVSALQRLETALNSGSAEAVAKALRPAWDRMQSAGLAVPFAALFAEPLAERGPHAGPAAQLAFRIGLLSPAYETVARTPPEGADAEALWLADLAQGKPGTPPAADPVMAAIAEAFTDAPALPAPLAEAIRASRTGEAVLRAISRLDRGARGNPGEVMAGLAALRALGLEDVARRAALQLVLLPGTA